MTQKYYDEHGNEVNIDEVKPRQKGGCLKMALAIIGVIVLMVIIGVAFTDVDTDTELEEPKTTETAAIEEAEVEEVVNETETQAIAETEAETEPEEEPIEESVEEAEFNPNDYNPELTYEDLARNPDENLLKRVTFEGKIIQVMQGDESSQYRLAANGDYNNVFLLEISNDQLDQRILDDDYIRFYGMFMGEITYESALGGNITVPGVLVDEFEFK